MTTFEPSGSTPRQGTLLLKGPGESLLTRLVKRLSGERITTSNGVARTLIAVACIMVVLTVVVLLASRGSASKNNRGIEQHGGWQR